MIPDPKHAPHACPGDRTATEVCKEEGHRVPLEVTKRDGIGNGQEFRCGRCGATRVWGYPWKPIQERAND